jgi:hypothetical protein
MTPHVGAESLAVKRELAKPEHADRQNYTVLSKVYSPSTNKYSRGVMGMVGPLNTLMLQQLVREVESASNEKCARLCKRSEPLMLKWRWKRQQNRSRQPVETDSEFEAGWGMIWIAGIAKYKLTPVTLSFHA